jgi:membrane protease YdiL (CAAX protease family)
LVGITEEFIYRGVLFSYFISNSNVLFSVIFISVIFSLGHVNYSGFLPFLTAFMMSIVSIQLLVLTKSLYASVGMHSSWNFFYSILDQTYDLKLNIIPFWGNLFEIHQMALFFILFLILLAILKKKKISYQNFKSWRTLKETETQMKLAG